MLRRILALLVVCPVTAAWAAAPLAIGSVTIAAPADPSAAPKYGKVELLVALTGGTFTSVYDPRPSAGGLDLRATFTAPGGAQTTVPGFYDGASWRVRFAPTLTGTWTFSVSAQDSSGTANWSGGTFTCVASAAPGFARIDGKNLRFSEGTVLYAIGANNGWQYDLEQPAFATMAAQGINLMSFWLAAPWIKPSDNIPRTPIENADEGIGQYNQAACAYLDGVIARAEAGGVCLLPSIWAHDQLCDSIPNGWPASWQNNAYKTLCSATDFYKTTSGSSDTAQWVYQKNFYRYLLARWGYSRAIIGWVAVVEIDGTTGYAQNPSQCSTWSSSLRAYFAASDPYRLSTASKYPLSISKVDQPGFDIGQDMRATDSYASQTDNIAVAQTIASQTATMRSSGKPAFHSEFGSSLKSLQPAHLHNGTWAGSSAGACMAPLLWCDNGSFPMLTDPDVGTALQNNLSFLAQFTSGIDYIGASGYTAATVTVAPATSRGWGMRLGDRGFAWIQNTIGAMGGQTAAISTLAPAGRYLVAWYDTWKSAADQTLPSSLVAVGSNGVLSLTVPALAQNDIAVKFLLQPNRAPVNTAAPVVSGTNALGGTLTTTNGAWTDADVDTLTYAYQWQRADSGSGTGATNIGANSNAYTLALSEAHKYIRVTVTANDGYGGTTPVSTTWVQVGDSAPLNNVTPVVSGTYAVGGTLTTTNGTWTDADGDTLAYSYQWQRADSGSGSNATNIGADSNAYALALSEAHKYIRVTVTANDGYGGTTPVSTTWVQVGDSAPANSAPPVVSGTYAVGGALTTTNGAWTDADVDTLAYSYQWQRADTGSGTNAANIGADSNAYALALSEAHKYIRVTVTANDGYGGNTPVSTAWVQAGDSAPLNTGTPVVSGTYAVDGALTATNGNWTDADGDALTYACQWLRADDAAGTNSSPIAGASGPTYTLALGDGAKYVCVKVTADDGYGGTASAQSVYSFVTPSPPVITSSASDSVYVGQAFSYQITASNSPTSYDATGLPASWSVNKSTGVISGIPTTASTISATLSAANAGGTGLATLTITVNPAPAGTLDVFIWVTLRTSVHIAWGDGTTGKTAGEVSPLDWTVQDSADGQVGRGATCVSGDEHNHVAMNLENTSNTGTKARVSAALTSDGGWNIGSAPATDTFVIQAQLAGNSLATLTPAAQELTDTLRLAKGADQAQALVLTVKTPTDVTRDTGVQKTIFVTLTATPE